MKCHRRSPFEPSIKYYYYYYFNLYLIESRETNLSPQLYPPIFLKPKPPPQKMKSVTHYQIPYKPIDPDEDFTTRITCQEIGAYTLYILFS